MRLPERADDGDQSSEALEQRERIWHCLSKVGGSGGRDQKQSDGHGVNGGEGEEPNPPSEKGKNVFERRGGERHEHAGKAP